MRGFWGTLNYSSVNEDWRTEATALRLRDGDRVLAITGGGGRVLDLLAVAGVRVVGIDRDGPQNHLLWLKLEAMRRLAWPEYAAFLGLVGEEPRAREATLASLLRHLPPDTRAFWSANVPLVRGGVLYAGRFERWFRRASRLARLLHPRLVDDLFAIDDLEAQRVFVAQRWNRAAWRRTFEFALSPAVSRIFYGDPAWYAHAQVAPGPYIFERFTEGLGRCLARDSFMAGLTLRGRLTPADLPPHLTPDGVAAIVPRLGSVTSVTADLGHYLGSGAERFDRFSLSDVASYLPESGFHALVRAAVGAALPGARVVMRQFLTRYPLPAEVAPALRREPALEAELGLMDRAFAYAFIIGEVVDGVAG